MATEPAEGVRIRTISFFIGNETIGHDEIAAAAAFLRKAKEAFEAAGALPPLLAPPPLPPALNAPPRVPEDSHCQMVYPRWQATRCRRAEW